jgi:ribokinase
MNDRRRITIVGSANADLTFLCDALPVEGQTIAATAQHWACGGKGANQAVAAARLGADVTFVGRIGSDAFGDKLRDALLADGIDVGSLGIAAGEGTGLAIIAVDLAGRNFIILQPGANAQLRPDHVDQARDSIRESGVVIAQLEVPLATVEAAARTARQEGARFWLNPAPAIPLPASLLATVDLLLPNQHEAALLTGLPTQTIDEASLAAEWLQAQGCATVIVTLGADGVVIADAAGTRHQPGWTVTAIDSTGAGDSFVGALAAGVVAGMALDEAVAAAQAAAALSVTRPGAQAALPSATEVREFRALYGAG